MDVSFVILTCLNPAPNFIFPYSGIQMDEKASLSLIPRLIAVSDEAQNP